MSDKTTEQAAEEYSYSVANNKAVWKLASQSFTSGAKFKESQLSATIADLQAENERLKQALKEIEQMSDCGSYAASIAKMKGVATEALTPNNTK